ncbi:hypothetical protein [Streptomyces sp. 5-10]|uniref:hypothetical protein n=1 Tax=Streptomyces sp. 5-10 TaxID=878925 RepID=UPI00168AF677|nr:hypothetical protein [Streptomyces sp. 5-10]MBD3004664.1 hypothetical protein [Streptomyces sp. 5-10]
MNAVMLDAAHKAVWRLHQAMDAAYGAAVAAGRNPGDTDPVRLAVAEYRGGLDVLAGVLDESGEGGLLPPPSERGLRRRAVEVRFREWVKKEGKV